MNKLVIAIFVFFLSGCNSVLITYEQPQGSDLTTLKLPPNKEVLYKIGEIDENGCASNTRTVRDASYTDNENVPVRTDKGIYLHVNVTGSETCRGSKAMFLEKGKQYEAYVLPVPYVCGILIYEIVDGKKGDTVETKNFKKGCIKE